MAYQAQTSIDLSYQAGEDLSSNQWQFVYKNPVSNLVRACPTNQIPLGILSNVPTATIQGQYAATVAVVGVTRLCVGAAYPIDTYLVPGTDGTTLGLGYSVADAGSSSTYIRARMLEASSNAYDIVSVLLCDAGFGTMGATGLPGPASGGATGVQGLAGATGVGAQGQQGVTGLNGLNGVTGLNGLQGVTGIQGETGIAP